MDHDQLYNIAYKYLLAGIRFGRYPDGASLPSVPELCRSFDASRITIHNALKMLEEEGYVSLCQGRSAIVTYATQPEARRERYIFYCQSTKDALLDLSEVFPAIWPEALAQGIQLCDEQALEELAGLIPKMPRRMEYPYLEFYTRILQQLGNPLLINLYLSTILFGQYTTMRMDEQERREAYLASLRETSLRILTLRKAHKYDELKETLRGLYQKRLEVVRLFYSLLPAAGDPVQSVPYCWNYYTTRPSIGFTFAMKLLCMIYAGYQPMDYLPSTAALSKRYSIPVITVRRSIQILREIGIVETVNGKGTRVIVGAGKTVDRSRLPSPNMKKALLPYLQSVQIILLISGDVARAFFPSLPDSAVRSAIALLREILSSEDYTLTFSVVFKLLLENAHSPALKEILGGLMHLQYLGYPLRDLEPNGFRYDPRSTKALLKSLENQDAEQFSTELQRLMVDIFQAGREKLISGGIPEAEAVALPPLSWRTERMRNGGAPYGDRSEL